MYHSRSLHSFTSFGCLRGAALTISLGHVVRALDLKLGSLPQVQVAETVSYLHVNFATNRNP
jgi:hypothetical protein